MTFLSTVLVFKHVADIFRKIGSIKRQADMDLLKALLGFVVLTGPLWLILILLPVSLWIAVKVSKRFKPGGVRLAGGLGIFLLAFLLPFADEIAGRVYFSHLCATEAGVKVYQTVELPAEYWDEEGRARFRVYEGASHKTMFLMGGSKFEDTRFEYSMFVEPYSSLFHTEKTGFRLRERESGKILGEVLYFRYWHGWLARNLSANRSAVSCEMKNLDDWKSNIFRPSTAE